MSRSLKLTKHKVPTRSMIPLTEKYVANFWKKVVKHHGCWGWNASTHRYGYGVMGIGRETYTAHRISWFIHFGEIPAGQFVCHRCDNPVCSNPKHLFLGYPVDNVRDMVRKGRAAVPWTAHVTHCPRGHEYTVENTRIDNDGGRNCRSCSRLRTRERSHSLKL